MRLETALHHAREVARRIHSVNGLLCTPLCDFEAQRVSRAWLFGSAARLKEHPNDVDILLEIRGVGRRFNSKQTKVDRDQLRRYGYRLAPSGRAYAYKWLRRGMQNISLHNTEIDGKLIGNKKIMIYPRMDLR